MSIPTAGESMFDLDTQPQHIGHGSHRCAAPPCKATEERASKRSIDWEYIVSQFVSPFRFSKAAKRPKTLHHFHLAKMTTCCLRLPLPKSCWDPLAALYTPPFNAFQKSTASKANRKAEPALRRPLAENFCRANHSS